MSDKGIKTTLKHPIYNKLYEIITQFGGISEQQKPCIQETEEK